MDINNFLPIKHQVDGSLLKSLGANNINPTMVQARITDNNIQKIKQISFIYYFLIYIIFY